MSVKPIGPGKSALFDSSVDVEMCGYISNISQAKRSIVFCQCSNVCCTAHTDVTFKSRSNAVNLCEQLEPSCEILDHIDSYQTDWILDNGMWPQLKSKYKGHLYLTFDNIIPKIYFMFYRRFHFPLSLCHVCCSHSNQFYCPHKYANHNINPGFTNVQWENLETRARIHKTFSYH